MTLAAISIPAVPGFAVEDQVRGRKREEEAREGKRTGKAAKRPEKSLEKPLKSTQSRENVRQIELERRGATEEDSKVRGRRFYRKTNHIRIKIRGL